MTVAEVKVGMWALKSFKALGADRLHASFFQRFCHEVQEAISSEVVLAFQSGNIPDYLNETLLALIPKCQNPETLGNFRPISLCNSVYKVITKIITTRLRNH